MLKSADVEKSPKVDIAGRKKIWAAARTSGASIEASKSDRYGQAGKAGSSSKNKSVENCF